VAGLGPKISPPSLLLLLSSTNTHPPRFPGEPASHPIWSHSLPKINCWVRADSPLCQPASAFLSFLFLEESLSQTSGSPSSPSSPIYRGRGGGGAESCYPDPTFWAERHQPCLLTVRSCALPKCCFNNSVWGNKKNNNKASGSGFVEKQRDAQSSSLSPSRPGTPDSFARGKGENAPRWVPQRGGGGGRCPGAARPPAPSPPRHRARHPFSF